MSMRLSSPGLLFFGALDDVAFPFALEGEAFFLGSMLAWR